VGVPDTTVVPSRGVLGGPGPRPVSDSLLWHREGLDENALSTLQAAVLAGHHPLEANLSAIASAAQILTGASGSAIAMWKETEMVCRARSGSMAPRLGARLGMEAGISAKCLHTGEQQYCRDTSCDARVDAELCRCLGLRSLAAVAIRGENRVHGILEVFSSESDAFAPQHLAVLEELAGLAERARATQPYSPLPLLLGMATVLAVLLFALAFWLGWRA